MKRTVRIDDLGGAHAIVLHRPHPVVAALTRQLQAVGLRATACWPDLQADALAADFVFFDADMGFDEQFPWAPGTAPMPLIALIGSEAPGRIEWALSTGATAQILKPVGDSGVYSALLIASNAFEARRGLTAQVTDLRNRLAERQTIVRAVVLMIEKTGSDAAAYSALRKEAMDSQISLEEAAARVVARMTEPDGRQPRGGVA